MPQLTEAMYEYRMRKVIRRVLREIELNPKNMTGDELSQQLYQISDGFGIAVLQDMFAWMEEDSWLELVRGG